MQPLPNRILPFSHALSLVRFVGVNDLTLSIFLVMTEDVVRWMLIFRNIIARVSFPKTPFFIQNFVEDEMGWQATQYLIPSILIIC